MIGFPQRSVWKIVLRFLWIYLNVVKIYLSFLLFLFLYSERIDFFDFRFGKYHYPVFNIADCFIVIGVIILIGYTAIEGRKNGSKSRCK